MSDKEIFIWYLSLNKNNINRFGHEHLHDAILSNRLYICNYLLDLGKTTSFRIKITYSTNVDIYSTIYAKIGRDRFIEMFDINDSFHTKFFDIYSYSFYNSITDFKSLDFLYHNNLIDIYKLHKQFCSLKDDYFKHKNLSRVIWLFRKLKNKQGDFNIIKNQMDFENELFFTFMHCVSFNYQRLILYDDNVFGIEVWSYLYTYWITN